MCGCVAVATTTEHEFQNNTRKTRKTVNIGGSGSK
jgi:hypothetical protein